ncbi:MAG: hypothetical protein ABEL76_02105 [Bradymonadaceae bacterium]
MVPTAQCNEAIFPPADLVRMASIAGLLAIAGALTACQAGLGKSCKGDSDCRADQICAAGSCTRTCDGDDDCTRSGFTCQPYRDPRSGTVINACQRHRTDVGTDSSFRCQTDRECRRRFDAGRATCGLSNTCIIAPEKHVGVRLRDLTDVGDPPSPGPDGGLGADIGAVVLTGPDGDPTDARAFADAVRYEPKNDAADSAHLDGASPALDGECVKGSRAGATTPLGGTGGTLIVELVDASGEPVDVHPRDKLVVVEWGANCGVETDTQDRFSVALCVSTGDADFVPKTDCRKELGTGSGFEVFPVEGTRSE